MVGKGKKSLYVINFFFWEASKKDLVLKSSQQGSKGQSILPKGLEKLASAKAGVLTAGSGISKLQCHLPGATVRAGWGWQAETGVTHCTCDNV